MITKKVIPILLGALSCFTPSCLLASDADPCPELTGKDAASRAEYLRGDRSKLNTSCILNAIRYVGGSHYTQGGAVLIRYLDYRDPKFMSPTDPKASIILFAYPAVDALYGLGKPVLPELFAAIANVDTPEFVRHNAAEAIALIHGSRRPAAIGALVDASRVETDPNASIRLMDQARWLAATCMPELKNDCENAVLK